MAPRATLDRLPRLGLVTEPTPVTALPGSDAGWLGVKRDDLLGPLFGGTKVRKLDTLLAHAPWRDAPKLMSVGAVGSGHLVALAAATERLDRPLRAGLFWGEPTVHALENLAYVATRADLCYCGGRLGLALRERAALTGLSSAEEARIPPGGSIPEGALGLVLAGLELADQVHSGLLPPPDDLFLALGSGGTAAGLSLGLGLGGLRPVVRAVAVVERPLATEGRLLRLRRQVARWLAERGVDVAEPAPLRVVHGHVGPGYSVPTPGSWRAVAELRERGLPGEPAYTGKAWGAMLDHVAGPGRGKNVLFWATARRGPLPIHPDWRERLPPALARRLERRGVVSGPLPDSGEREDRPRSGALSRRGLLWGGAALLAAAGGWRRLSGYAAFPAWEGALLWAWEAEVLAAAAEALLPPAPINPELIQQIPLRADRFLASLPEHGRREIHALFALIEHGTALDLSARRFSRLPTGARLSFLDTLGATPLGHLAARGLRDLVLLGYYQDPMSWPELGYTGPWVPGPRPDPRYDALAAPEGALPRSLA